MPKRPPLAGFRPAARKSWDHGGKSRHERGYGAKWDRLRKIVLARDRHLCQPCLEATPRRITAAREVDHILSKAKGGTDALENLRATCTPCHQAKTIAEQGKKQRRKRRTYGADGWPIEE